MNILVNQDSVLKVLIEFTIEAFNNEVAEFREFFEEYKALKSCNNSTDTLSSTKRYINVLARNRRSLYHLTVRMV